jgi:hypothetical protein
MSAHDGRIPPQSATRAGKSGIPGFKIIFVLSAILLGMATATQHFARHFAYHESLGPTTSMSISPA